jgi:predicted transcriptional regulator
MKGLIIKPKWAELILDGHKTIEVRGSYANIRGTIGIIKSGSKKVFGTVELTDCIELTKHNFDILQNKHKLDITYDELLKIYPKPYGWCLTKVTKYDSPIDYKHKQGCVIWVNLDEKEARI